MSEQFDIGNGSILELDGTEGPMIPFRGGVPLDPPSLAWLRATIDANTLPDGMDRATFIEKHAKAFKVRVSQCTYNDDCIRLMNYPLGRHRKRLRYCYVLTDRIDDFSSFLEEKARSALTVWLGMQYVYFPAGDNEILLEKEIGHRIPIRPRCLGRKFWESETREHSSIGFTGVAENMALHIFNSCYTANRWVRIEPDFRMTHTTLSKQDFIKGMSTLCEQEYIYDYADKGYLIRKKFVSHCWRQMIKLA